MELSQSLFEQIIQCAGVRANDSSRERRQSRRFPFSHRITVVSFRDGVAGPTAMVRARDLSRTGIGLLLTHKPAIGARYGVRLPRREDEPVWASIVIRRCQLVSEGLFLAGGRFEQLLDQEPTPMAPANSPGDAERRKAAQANEIDRIRQSILS